MQTKKHDALLWDYILRRTRKDLNQAKREKLVWKIVKGSSVELLRRPTGGSLIMSMKRKP